jgi:hypothetical protein
MVIIGTYRITFGQRRKEVAWRPNLTRGEIMTNNMETFIVKVTDAQGDELFIGSFQAATYHRALRFAWAETNDDPPLKPAVATAGGSRAIA